MPPTTEGKLPEILYHYTSQEGLLGIIKDKEIWATNIFHLNDSAEYEYAVEILKKILNKHLASLPQTNRLKIALPIPGAYERKEFVEIESDFLNNILSLSETFNYPGIYICSFSAVGDQLSQWRAYSPHSNGFSLGFKTSDLVQTMQKKGFSLVRCIYEQEKQKTIIKELIDKYLGKLKLAWEKRWGDKYWEPMFNSLMTGIFIEFMNIAPQLKDTSFYEEKEWRFIGGLEISKNKVLFRKGLSMPISYTVVPLAEGTKNIPFKHIIIGPTPHKELSKKSVDRMLWVNKIKKCEVTLSATQYRTW